MSKRRRKKKKDLDPTLFDLPLHGDGVDQGAAAEEVVATSVDELPLSPSGDQGGETLRGAEEETRVEERDLREEPMDEVELGEDEPAAPGVLDRLFGGLVDLAVQIGVVVLAAFLARALGVPVGFDDWPPLLVLGLVFSFLYWFIPLAFWGHTPGMAWVGHTARSLDGEPLTFSQTVLRWLGSLLTLSLVGLPLLLALGGRSLTDRLSESRTER